MAFPIIGSSYVIIMSVQRRHADFSGECNTLWGELPVHWCITVWWFTTSWFAVICVNRVSVSKYFLLPRLRVGLVVIRGFLRWNYILLFSAQRYADWVDCINLRNTTCSSETFPNRVCFVSLYHQPRVWLIFYFFLIFKKMVFLISKKFLICSVGRYNYHIWPLI